MSRIAKIGILGASGYTGSECVRLLLRHPQVEIALLTADRRAGHEMREVFPQFSPFALPRLVAIDGLDWAALGLDLVFCALPHATTQKVVKDLLAKALLVTKVRLVTKARLATTRDPVRTWEREACHPRPHRRTARVFGRMNRARNSRAIRGWRIRPKARAKALTSASRLARRARFCGASSN